LTRSWGEWRSRDFGRKKEKKINQETAAGLGDSAAEQTSKQSGIERGRQIM